MIIFYFFLDHNFCRLKSVRHFSCLFFTWAYVGQDSTRTPLAAVKWKWPMLVDDEKRQKNSILFPLWSPPGPPVVAARCDSRGSGQRGSWPEPRESQRAATTGGPGGDHNGKSMEKWEMVETWLVWHDGSRSYQWNLLHIRYEEACACTLEVDSPRANL